MARTRKAGEEELIGRYVDQDVDRYSGGRAEARLIPSGVSVWAIVSFLKVYDGSTDKVVEHFGVKPVEVEAALAYYRLNKQIIDARVALNEA